MLGSKNGLSLVEVDLLTGRTHQIRAHMAWLGNPLLGDGKYGKEKVNRFRAMFPVGNIDEFYSKPDKFGELQYLDPYAHDATAISYEEKLKKFLESVLISNEMAERIRKAFDAYIFLSYRKKDRKYANQLMRLIHSNPECRDIAIWFDEFLTPGESFKDSIDKILGRGKG